jgi:3-carboxy-cis,cis-muconate cycloisomerase
VDTFFRDPEMAAIFAADTTIRQMLRFEAALARAEARAGVIPATAADAISAACETAKIDAIELFRDAATAGTPVIPLVRIIGELAGPEAAEFVHWGATSQDTIDTALMLQMREGIDLLVHQLLKISETAASLAREHRHTIMAGRTLLQQAVPITFGLKAARWLQTVVRLNQRLNALRTQSLAIQFGGAAGTLAVLGTKGPEVATFLADELDLPEPALPWHAERERVAEVATALGMVSGSMAKIATDLMLLQQSEIAELSPSTNPKKGTSSAMPQKRNPVDAAFASAAARLAIGDVSVVLNAMSHPYERAAGEWQAEWESIPDLFCHATSAVDHVRVALENLDVDVPLMRANIDASGGFIMAESLSTALAAKTGRQHAFRLTQELAQSALKLGIGLREALETDERTRHMLDAAELDRVFDPAAYLGSTDTFIDRALGEFEVVHKLAEP